MSELYIVRQLAREGLTIATLTGEYDSCLWQRSERLVRNVEQICSLPEIKNSEFQIDRFCLDVAAYFSDTGLARYLESREENRKLVFGNGNGLLSASTEIVTEKLRGVISRQKIEKINKIISESGDRFTERIESMILSDARNLDDMGVIGLFNEIRRQAIEGRGVSEVLHSWERKKDYRYWQARLKEGFRFESIRKIAKKRLSAADSFMNQLKKEAHGSEKPVLS